MHTRKTNKVVRLFRILLFVLWGAIIVCCIVFRERISVERILNAAPQNPWAAATVMLAFFALKSLSIVIYSGMLYAVNGILFALPAAIVLNICGTAIMITIPYCIGKKIGTPAVNYVKEKYPKAERIQELRTQNDGLFSFIIRVLGILPCDIVSLYMGAIGVKYGPYLCGGLLGMLPATITFPIMGMSVSDIRSPSFKIALGAEIMLTVLSTAGYKVYRNRHEGEKHPQKGEANENRSC